MDKDTARNTALLLSELIYILGQMENGPLLVQDFFDLRRLALQAQQLAKPT